MAMRLKSPANAMPCLWRDVIRCECTNRRCYWWWTWFIWFQQMLRWFVFPFLCFFAFQKTPMLSSNFDDPNGNSHFALASIKCDKFAAFSVDSWLFMSNINLISRKYRVCVFVCECMMVLILHFPLSIHIPLSLFLCVVHLWIFELIYILYQISVHNKSAHTSCVMPFHFPQPRFEVHTRALNLKFICLLSHTACGQ